MKKIKNKLPHWLIIVLTHAVFLGVLLLCMFFESCPIHRFTGLPCPGCGMSRALLSLLKLDISSAWYYHPMIFVLPIALIYLVHRKAWKLPGSRKISVAIVIALIVSLILVYVIRAFIPGSFVYTDMQTSIFG